MRSLLQRAVTRASPPKSATPSRAGGCGLLPPDAYPTRLKNTFSSPQRGPTHQSVRAVHRATLHGNLLTNGVATAKRVGERKPPKNRPCHSTRDGRLHSGTPVNCEQFKHPHSRVQMQNTPLVFRTDKNPLNRKRRSSFLSPAARTEPSSSISRSPSAFFQCAPPTALAARRMCSQFVAHHFGRSRLLHLFWRLSSTTAPVLSYTRCTTLTKMRPRKNNKSHGSQNGRDSPLVSLF